MQVTERDKLEKAAAKGMEWMSDDQRIQFSIAVSLHRIANLMEKFHDDGIYIAPT